MDSFNYQEDTGPGAFIPDDVWQVVEPFMPDCLLTEEVAGVGLRFVFKLSNRIGASFVVLDGPLVFEDRPCEIMVLRFTKNSDDYLAFPENGITDRSEGGLAKHLSYKQAKDLLDELKGL